MFECQVELLSLIEEDGETIYFLVGQYSFDPGLQIGEEVWINCEVGGEIFSLKTKVRERKKEIYPKGSHSRNINESLFLLRIFVEAEDRERILAIQDFLERVCEFTTRGE
ncbi:MULTISPECIES: hypothetical protein [Nostocales]|uniref:Uncharacterized protein n=3 Tax=Nostocales TaxID=1161 RepID=A0A8S9T7A9_9CYAN|nr:hypothetical protein [Tolypothrix bouteillei]KAF3887877.1 hypothetical protein DA73_0400022070 [Tolypothrix bouteillei VB521301]